MRKDLAKLDDLKGSLIACTMELESARKDLYIVNHDYQALKEIERELIYNINFLRRTKVTVVAQEYGRSTKELAHIRKRLFYLDGKYVNILQECAKLEKKQSELMDQYDEQLLQCKNYKVVLPFDIYRSRKSGVDNEE